METGGKQLVNKATFARMINVDRSYLSKADVEARLEPAITRNGKKVLIDAEMAKAILKRETDTSKVRKAAQPEIETPDADAQAGEDDDGLELSPEDATSLDKHRRRNIHLKNEDLALRIAAQKSETLSRQGAYAAAAQAGQLIRENIYALIPGLAERAASMTDAREIRTMMDGAFRACLESVVNEFNRRIHPAGTGEGEPRAH